MITLRFFVGSSAMRPNWRNDQRWRDERLPARGAPFAARLVAAAGAAPPAAERPPLGSQTPPLVWRRSCMRPGKHYVSLTGCQARAADDAARSPLRPSLPRPQWVDHRPLSPSAPARSGCMTAQSATPQTTPTAHPKGAGVAPTGTRSHARASHFPMRGASPLRPAMHDPSGFQADPPLTLSPLR
jgi:hypothetical protein